MFAIETLTLFFRTVSCTEPFHSRAKLTLKDRRKWGVKWVKNEEECMMKCLMDDRCQMIFYISGGPLSDWRECYTIPELLDRSHFQDMQPYENDRFIAYRPETCFPRR